MTFKIMQAESIKSEKSFTWSLKVSYQSTTIDNGTVNCFPDCRNCRGHRGPVDGEAARGSHGRAEQAAWVRLPRQSGRRRSDVPASRTQSGHQQQVSQLSQPRRNQKLCLMLAY